MGEVDGETFINNSSIGLYPYLVREREQRRHQEGLSKWSALILSGLHELRHVPQRQMAITAEGFVEPCRSPIVVIGNNEYALDAPVFGRRERLDGGELCIYVPTAQSWLALLQLAARDAIKSIDNEAKRTGTVLRDEDSV